MRRNLLLLVGLLGLWGGGAARAQHFEPGPGLASLDAGATGVFDLGVARVGRADVILRALVHNGQVLQVQGRIGNVWLAKREGSTGGKLVAPTTLDQLVTIGGGAGIDMRCAPDPVREQFAREAAIVLPTGRGDCRVTAPAAAAAAGASVGSPAATRSGDCGPIGCGVLFRHALGNRTAFTIRIAPERLLWGFEGYGIVAIWGIPDG